MPNSPPARAEGNAKQSPASTQEPEPQSPRAENKQDAIPNVKERKPPQYHRAPVMARKDGTHYKIQESGMMLKAVDR